MTELRRCRVGFSVVGTGKDEFGLTVGVGQYVDLDTIPEAARPHIPEGAFDEPEPAPTTDDNDEPARRRRR